MASAGVMPSFSPPSALNASENRRYTENSIERSSSVHTSPGALPVAFTSRAKLPSWVNHR